MTRLNLILNQLFANKSLRTSLFRTLKTRSGPLTRQ